MRRRPQLTSPGVGPSAGQPAIRTVLTLGVLVLAAFHILFGFANFRPAFPELEGVAAILAGVALPVALLLARRSVPRALSIAFVGTLPLVAWFAYAVTIEKSSGPQFFRASLVLPTVTGTALVILRRRSGA